jgi:hypothetical protein
MADNELTPPVFPVAADSDAKVGEDAVQEPREVDAQVESREDDAQKVGQPAERVEKVPVYEVAVTTDERVDYVIVPPEGRGDATLPIHAFVGARTVEDVFAEEAGEQEEPASEEERAKAASEGRTAPRKADDKS